MTQRSPLAALAILLSSFVLCEPAFATPKEEGVQKYRQGRALIESKKYEEAIVELSASYELLDSPNTLLLMAHAHRELGRDAKAATLYEKVIVDAQERVAQGEQRFELTADDAKLWIGKLSAHLGKLSVIVSNAPEGSIIRFDGESVTTVRSSDGTLRTNAQWCPAGSVEVEVTTPAGATRALTAKVPKSNSTEIAFDLAEVDTTSVEALPAGNRTTVEDEPKTKDKSKSASIPTGSWVAGGVGVVGLASFALFGSMAKSKVDELEACAPRCPESKRETADAGRRDQTIANVGLAVGGVALVVAAGLYVFRSNSEPKDGSVAVGIAPNGVLLRGSFQ